MRRYFLLCLGTHVQNDAQLLPSAIMTFEVMALSMLMPISMTRMILNAGEDEHDDVVDDDDDDENDDNDDLPLVFVISLSLCMFVVCDVLVVVVVVVVVGSCSCSLSLCFFSLFFLVLAVPFVMVPLAS